MLCTVVQQAVTSFKDPMLSLNLICKVKEDNLRVLKSTARGQKKIITALQCSKKYMTFVTVCDEKPFSILEMRTRIEIMTNLMSRGFQNKLCMGRDITECNPYSYGPLHHVLN